MAEAGRFRHGVDCVVLELFEQLLFEVISRPAAVDELFEEELDELNCCVLGSCRPIGCIKGNEIGCCGWRMGLRLRSNTLV